MTDNAPVALITGAAHRLGAQTATELHHKGWTVIIHYRSREEQARALADSLNAQRSDSAFMVQGDLEQMDDISRIARQAVSFTGRLDGLVNNASAFFPTPVSEASEGDWNTLMNANLKAPFFLVQACLPALRQQRGGVVNMIDIYAERPLEDHPIYCASKAGLAALTRSLAKDLAPDIRVNGVSPGAILWPEQEDAMVQEHKDRILGKTPLQRTGDPTDIARTIAFLLCDAPYITGHIIPVDGGRSLSI